jgi:hypothetical protein
MVAIRLATVTILGLLLTPAQAGAQVFGTFSWQMLPYCNVVSLTLVNTPAGFTLEGTDNQCGAVNKAGAFGIASFNTSGNVIANFSIVTAPGGSPVHVSAIISPATGSGTWTDSAGNSGTFALSGATPGLPARPQPPGGLAVASVTAREMAPDAVTGVTVQNGSLSAVDLADAPRAASVEGQGTLTLMLTQTANVRQLTVDAPSAGRVIVTASTTVVARSTGFHFVQCSLTRGSTIEAIARIAASDTASVTSDRYIPLTVTRGFPVSAPGPVTVRLMCRSEAGVFNVETTSMTAMYFPG